MRTSYANARSRAGDWDLIAGSQAPQTVMGVVVCHPMTYRTSNFILGSQPQARNLIDRISSKFPTIVADLGGDLWGNDTALAAIGSAITTLQSATSPARAKAGKVLLVGASMGFQMAAAYARANPTAVAAIAGMIPGPDLNDVYANNRLGAAAVINAAYGGAYVEATHGPTRNPMVFASQLTLPIHLWYGSADAAALPERVEAFIAAAPNCTGSLLAGLTHDPEAVYAFALANGLIEFLQANA